MIANNGGVIFYITPHKNIYYIYGGTKMSQTYTVRINKKDLYKQNYNEKEYKDKCKEKNLVVKKSLIDLFVKILEEGA